METAGAAAEPAEQPVASPCLVFFNDGGKGLMEGLDPEEHEGLEGALDAYLGLVKEILQQTCSQKEYKHISFMETTSPLQTEEFTSPLALAMADQQLGPSGEVVGFTNVRKAMDLQGLLTANRGLPAPLNEKLGMEPVAPEEGEEEEEEDEEAAQPLALAIYDEELSRAVTAVEKRVGDMASRFQGVLDEEQEAALVEAFVSKAPQPESEEDEALQPIHPMDMLTVLVCFVGEFAGKPSGAAGGAGGRSLGALLGALRARGGRLLASAGRRTHSLQAAVWRVEDLATAGARLALKAARKGLRPVLMAYIVNRALRTIDASNMPGMKLARMEPKEAHDYYMRTTLGDNWRSLVEGDLVAAMKEVDEGLLTDEYAEEKRKLTAAMLRRLEVEEWDKQRMKHFYYGSYGLGPWYFDMEERLHNPYFMGARAWNGPIEGWVGKNKTFKDLDPAATDFASYALAAIETAKGKKLTPEQKERILAREQMPRASDRLLRKGGLLDGVVDKSKVQQ